MTLHNACKISNPPDRAAMNGRSNGTLALLVVLAACVAVAAIGCRSSGRSGKSARATKPSTQAGKPSRTGNQSQVKNIVCMFDQKPWINADLAGDRDPEGVQYRVFLDAGGARGVTREGTFHIEMYRLSRDPEGKQKRDLISDWRYPTSQFAVVSASLLGEGYHLRLRWARKDIAGSEVEIVTQFEDTGGQVIRGTTKRLRVPKYTS